MKKLLLILVSCVPVFLIHPLPADDKDAGERKIRDKNGNITGYVENTVNGKRIRDVNQNIVGTVDKKESGKREGRKEEPTK